MKLASTLLCLLVQLSCTGIAQADELVATDCKKVPPRKVELLNYEEPNTVQTGWLTVPVFYVTDRDASCNCFSQKQEKTNAKSNMHYGIKNVAAPETAYLKLESKQPIFKALGWEKTTTEMTRPSNSDLAAIQYEYPNQNFADYQSFKTKLEDYRKNMNSGSYKPRDEVVLFVHGCCQPFNNHMDHAAFFATWMKVPIISYDWTAPNVGLLSGKLTAYRQNEALNQRNQDRFNAFLDRLIDDVGPSKIVIVAHSMGNRLVEQALLRNTEKLKNSAATAPSDIIALRRKEQFKEVIFACADTDAIAFAEHIDQILISSQMTRIIQSKKDKLLKASEFFHGKFPRLGTVDTEVNDLLCPAAKASNNRLEIIDVTALDQNHSLPLWVISSLHKNEIINPKFVRVNVGGLDQFLREKEAKKINH